MVANRLNKIKEQSGYTILEMIGAMALVAILLMGGIRGIEWSFDRQHANELGGEIMQRAADIKMQLDRPGAKFRGSKWAARSHTGCPIEFTQDKKEVAIQVLNVKKRVCEMVFKELSHLDGVSRVEGNCANEGNNNTMIFHFDKFYAKTVVKKESCFCNSPKVCDVDGSCICPPDTPTGHEPDTCACPDYLIPVRGACLCPDESEPIDGRCGECEKAEDCGSGNYTCENHACTCIAKECSESDFADTSCNCCPIEQPKYKDGDCWSCANIDATMPVYNTATKECEACPIETPVWNGTSCEVCPDNTVWDGVTRQCVECVEDTDCAASGFMCQENMCVCSEGDTTPCSTNVVQNTNTSKYGQICYICSCPNGSVMNGNTCVCNNECQTYNTSTKACTNKSNGTTCSNGICVSGKCANDECPSGTQTSCPSNTIATKTSTTASGKACYTCKTCPSDAIMSGTTCVCNSECQTYNASTNTCVNKTNGTTCTNGLCSSGVCKDDTCPSGTSKTCSANLIATASSKTAYGTQCYTCGCPSGAKVSGTTCVCNSECQTYNTTTKTCVSKTDGTACTNGLCKAGTCASDTCPTGTSKSCSANLVATASSKTAYGTQCYTCGCPSGSTLSGTTCVCNNECQTYNTSTKTCANKTNGTSCSNGLCKNGTCTNDTCPSGTVKTCSSGTANKVSTTTYGSACYQCCASPKTYWNGSACACPTSTPKYANTSTCACASGETNQNGECTPSLLSTCKTYCQNRNSTSSSTTGQTCSSFTTLNGLNSVVSLQHSVSSTGSKSYEVVIKYTNKNNGGTETLTNKANGQEFETLCGYGTATVSGSDVNIYLQTTSTHTLCKGHKAGWIYCPVSGSKEISNAQKTTCDSFCNTYASRYGW